MGYKNTVTNQESSEEECQEVADLEAIYLPRTLSQRAPCIQRMEVFHAMDG